MAAGLGVKRQGERRNPAPLSPVLRGEGPGVRGASEATEGPSPPNPLPEYGERGKVFPRALQEPAGNHHLISDNCSPSCRMVWKAFCRLLMRVWLSPVMIL